MDIGEKIKELGLKDEGKKETRGNSGWEDKELETQMIATGWMEGQSWCAYWVEKIWCSAYRDVSKDWVRVLRRIFSANAVRTFDNFWDSNFKTSDKPVVGAVVIWKKVRNGEPAFVGNSQWISGHAGLVIDYTEGSSTFTTLEGNSNSEGGREGIEVARQIRKFDFNKENGLQLVGFIHPKQV